MRSAGLRVGAVAQLGERQNRTLEVGGSTPLCSTNDSHQLNPCPPITCLNTTCPVTEFESSFLTFGRFYEPFWTIANKHLEA